jgi:hypothetical protein
MVRLIGMWPFPAWQLFCFLWAAAQTRSAGGSLCSRLKPDTSRGGYVRRSVVKVVGGLDTRIEDLKSLPPHTLPVAADFIQRLKRVSQEDRQAILARTSGCISQEDAGTMEKAVEEGCEKIDEDGW